MHFEQENAQKCAFSWGSTPTPVPLGELTALNKAKLKRNGGGAD